jgi:PHD/YefM family antitoxin component YafN of YafNO toxin-antitoxin module
MTTKFIGIKDFRQNMAEYARLARAKTARYVVMNRNVPMFEVTPFDEDENLDYLFDKVMAAKAEADAGLVVSQDEVLAKLGLR